MNIYISGASKLQYVGGTRGRLRRIALRERGFALPVVLATLVPVALLTIYLATSGRSGLQVAAALRGSAQAETVADGAVFEAAFHLLDVAAPWPANGRPLVIQRSETRVRLCIVNEAGKINPNIASPGLIAALFQVVGVDTAKAERLAGAIYAWRTAAGNAISGSAGTTRLFGDVRELRLVPGMTPDLLQRARPYLTVLTDDQPDPRAASPVVLAALEGLLGLDPVNLTDPTRPRTVVIVAEAVTADSNRYVRRAGLRLGSGNEPSVQVLTWGQAERATCTTDVSRLAT